MQGVRVVDIIAKQLPEELNITGILYVRKN